MRGPPQLITLGLLLALISLLPTPTHGSRVTVLTRTLPPHPYTCTPYDAATRARLYTTFRIAVSLDPSEVDALHAAADKVSDPYSPEYGQFWTQDRLVAATPSGAEAGKRVQGALCSLFNLCGSPSVALDGDGVSLVVRDVSLDTLSEILGPHATLHSCSHPDAPELRFSAALGSLSLPSVLASDVAFLVGVSDFPDPSVLARVANRNLKSKGTLGGGGGPAYPCGTKVQANNLVLPEVARTLGGVPAGTRVTHAGATQAAVEFGLVVPHETGQTGGGGGGFLFSDLATFARGTNTDPGDFNISRIIGPFAQHNYTANAESVLDVTTLLGMAPGSPTTYATYLGWLYEFANHVLGDESRALVHSLSYGTPEYLQCNKTENGEPFDTCSLLGVDAQGYIDRVEHLFSKLSLLGVTIVASAGDNGAPGELSQTCQLDTTAHPLHTVYPAASAYVVAVGGVAMVEEGTGPAPGAPQPPLCSAPHPGLASPNTPACGGPPASLQVSSCINGGITGGGGFSNYTVRKPYQDPFVEHYLATAPDLPPHHAFDRSHLGIPDVTHLATNIIIVLNGAAPVGAGTSASAPQVAGILTLINSALLEHGASPLGNPLPMLYALPSSAFIDVTSGNNACTELACCKYGYSAVPGWDAASGRGVIQYPALLSFLSSIHNIDLQQ